MRFAPRSLGGRLLFGSAAFTVVALGATLILMQVVLHRFVVGQVDQRLDDKVVALESQTRIESDGTLRLEGDGDGPPFDRPERGSFWRIVGPRNALQTRWLDGRPPISRAPSPQAGVHPRSFDMEGPEGRPVHVRARRREIGGSPVVTLAAAPLDAVDGPVRQAMATVGSGLALLGLALLGAILLQVRLGLLPLGRLREQLAEVRAGRQARLPPDQPTEVLPLVAEMNVLLDQNAANLTRARRHVANLAHGLKTPLASLFLALERVPSGDREVLRGLCGLMDRRIRHHLRRARAAALLGPVRDRTLVADALNDLAAVMRRLHADRPVGFRIECPPDLAVACERQDLDEILGNLLDNAFKWTRSAVRCGAGADGAAVWIEVDDDGPGLEPDEIERVLKPGERLDEAVPGDGFGLPIARELTELYSGALVLSHRGPGLRVRLTLPRCADVPGQA